MSKQKTLWRKGLLLLVIAAAAGGGLWYWQRPNAEKIEYQTVAVMRGPLLQMVTATGTLNPVTNVTVGSQISGIIQEIFVDFNSRVTAGQVVARLDPATFQANVASAEGELANSRANLELATVDYRRAGELLRNRLISQSEYDRAAATRRQAEAAVQIREASLQRARVDLARCTIYSPVDGIVISRDVNVGQTVAASMSAPTLFVIANDLTRMQINANVAEADVGGVEAGQEVEFTVDAFPFRTFRGSVVQVRNSPVTVQNVVTYDTVVEVNNDDLELKPGMTANVSIVVDRRENALLIPNAALRFRPPENANALTNPPAAGNTVTASAGGGRGVRARGERSPMRTVHTLDADGQLRPVQVKIGISDGLVTEAVEGLADGAILVAGVAPNSRTAAAAAPSNPFGGGGFPRRF